VNQIESKGRKIVLGQCGQGIRGQGIALAACGFIAPTSRIHLVRLSHKSGVFLRNHPDPDPKLEQTTCRTPGSQPGLAAPAQTLYEARSHERPLENNVLVPTHFRLIRGFHGRS